MSPEWSEANKVPKWWLLVGSPKNWQIAFEQGNLWGFKETQRNLWEHLGRGDGLLLYAGYPVVGLIGLGQVQSKFVQNIPLWPDEVKKNEVIWPLRIEIDVQYCFPEQRWQQDKIITPALLSRARRRQMLQMLEEEFAKELIDNFPPAVKAALLERTPEAAPTGPHGEIVLRLLEIGRLQNFIAEREYDMEGNRLDVVWRRVTRSVPTYVFEVHIGGDIYHALAKLKHAFDIWNSNIFLVSTPEVREPSDKLLSGMFHEIQGRLKFIEVGKVMELSTKKRDVYDLEQELGIL